MNKSECKVKCKELSLCVLIPTYNNQKTLENVVKNVLEWCESVIVVNDGATDKTAEIIVSFGKTIDSLAHYPNRGKGYALRSGFKYASEKGFKYAITIDSDGQHFAEDIPQFIEMIEKEPGSIIVGARNMEQSGVPKKSSFGHKFSNFWFEFETGITLPDTQSGYRLYPLFLLKEMRFFTPKYEFEIEVIVRAAWKGIKVTSVPVKVIYEPKETRVSHFRPFHDFSRVSVLNTILVLITILWVKPFSLLKNLNRKSVMKFIEKEVLAANDSNRVITLSLMLGIFMGIAPFWGWQMIFAASLAHAFKLNKVHALIGSNISVPPAIPFILYFSYLVGTIVIPENNQLLTLNSNISFDSIQNNLVQYIAGSFALAAAASVTFGCVIFCLLFFFRKKGR